MSNKHGSKWITREKRLAIYLRDGMACVYCGSTVENGITLSLDHVECRTNGGSNHESNLVTSCTKCNSIRADRDLVVFCDAVAGYLNHGVTGEQIVNFINETTARPLAQFKSEAKAIIARRSGFSQAIAEATRGK